MHESGMGNRNQAAPQESAPNPPIERLTYRFPNWLSLGVSRRTLERQRGTGKLLKPSIRIGKTPLWSRDAVRDSLRVVADNA